MDRFVNPQVATFRRQLTSPTVFVQVLLNPGPAGIELRHVEDSAREQTALRAFAVDQLAPLADTTASGAFRPNKAAPTLRVGWRCLATSDEELGLALDCLYPGALADWFAREQKTPTVTSFREFMSRQTGMYRGTQDLTDEQADEVTRAGCHSRFCLRQRCWSAPGLGPDPVADKSVAPCLEPCALLLEFARRTSRQGREEQIELHLAASDVESLETALLHALEHPLPTIREGDLRAPGNPRRLQWVLHRLQTARQPIETKLGA